MKTVKTLLLLAILTAFFSSCTTSQFATKNATTYVELKKDDLQLSERMSAEAKEVRILGINFAAILHKESANFDANGYASNSRIPILGSSLNPTRVQNSALHNLLEANEGYDFVMYPRFEEKTKGFLFFYKRTNSKVSARLVKL